MTSAGYCHEGAADLSHASGETARSFSRIAAAFEKTSEAIFDAGQRDAEKGKDSTDLEKTAFSATSIVETANSIADRTDVTAVNASLEASRAGKSGAMLSVVADAIRKAADMFIRTAKDISSAADRVKSCASDAGKKRERAGERLRTVSVLAGSIQGALDDVGGLLDDFRESVDSLSMRVDAALSSYDDLEPDIISMLDSLQAAADEAEETLSFFREADSAPDVLRLADRLAVAAGELSENDGGVLEDVMVAAENLAGALEDGIDRLKNPDSVLGGLIGDCETTVTGLDSAVGAAESSTKVIGEMTKAVQEARGRLDTFRSRLTETTDVMRDLSREYTGLVREDEAFAGAVAALRDRAWRLAGYEAAVADFRSRLDSLSVTGGLECLRAGNDADAFRACLSELDTISADAGKLAVDISALTDSLLDKTAIVARRNAVESWSAGNAAVRSLIDDIELLLDGGAASAENALDSIDRVAAEARADSDAFCDRASSLRTSVETAVAKVRDASEALHHQIDDYTRLAAETKKVLTLTGEMDNGGA
jgi:methyl-accepting chemotaxis protein